MLTIHQPNRKLSELIDTIEKAYNRQESKEKDELIKHATEWHKLSRKFIELYSNNATYEEITEVENKLRYVYNTFLAEVFDIPKPNSNICAMIDPIDHLSEVEDSYQKAMNILDNLKERLECFDVTILRDDEIESFEELQKNVNKILNI